MTAAIRVASARTRVERNFDPRVVRELKASTEHDLTVEGPVLAASALRAELVDEIAQYLSPAVVGGGTRFLPDGVRLGDEGVSAVWAFAFRDECALDEAAQRVGRDAARRAVAGIQSSIGRVGSEKDPFHVGKIEAPVATGCDIAGGGIDEHVLAMVGELAVSAA